MRNLQFQLRALADLAEEARAPMIAEGARTAAAILEEGHFYVACLGQFKRGKSTFLNALIGQQVLASGIPPITSVVTVLRYASVAQARFRTPGQEWRSVPLDQVDQWTSEIYNPQNQLGVGLFEIALPATVLKGGLCLVDTPGLGSAWPQESEFLPRIDGLILVSGGEPPLSHEELEVLKRLVPQVDLALVVSNKSDRYSQEQLREVRELTRSVWETHLAGHPLELYEVSALEVVQGRDDCEDWKRLQERLAGLGVEGGQALALKRALRAWELLSLQLEQHLAWLEQALRQPLQELEQRIEALSETLERARQSIRQAHSQLWGEQEHLHAELLKTREAWLKQKPEHDLTIAYSTQSARAMRLEARSETRRWAEARMERWRLQLGPAVSRHYRQFAQKLGEEANQFLNTLHQSGLSSPCSPLALAEELTRPSRYCFAEHWEWSRTNWMKKLRDRIRGHDRLERHLKSHSLVLAAHLLQFNTLQILNDYRERLVESLQSTERMLVHQLERICEQNRQSLLSAQEARGQESAQLGLKLDQLSAWQRKIKALQNPARESGGARFG